MTSEDRIAKLDAHIRRTQAELVDLRKQLAKAQIDQWGGARVGRLKD
jgi:hypothetical protein